MNTRRVECPECDGYGLIEVGCGGGCGSSDCHTYTCDDCNGSGEVHKLCDTDGCNHEDCEAAAREERLRESARVAHEHQLDRDSDRD